VRTSALSKWRVARFATATLALLSLTGVVTPVAGQDWRARYPGLAERPLGKGIFAHARKPSGRTAPAAEIAAWAQHPHIAGTQLSYTWVELEPREGDYRWELIEHDMEPWARAGKKCWIEISTANARDVSGGRTTPAWVFEKGVPSVGGQGTARYPVFWNQKYIELWGNFVRAFARKFDGDPRIEFVSTGGYSSGHEPGLASRDTERLMGEWQRAGFDGFSPSGIYLNGAIKPILAIYASAFRRTPVAQTIHVRTDFARAMNEFAAGKGFILISNGLSLKNSTAEGRQAWRNLREQLNTKVGFAEWGPAGRRTDLVRSEPRRERRAGRQEGRVRGARERNPAVAAKLIDAYRAAIGDDDDPSLRPWSRLSYLPLAGRIPEVETEEEWNAALRWAWEHLDG
jgi:hypothetical protein